MSAATTARPPRSCDGLDHRSRVARRRRTRRGTGPGRRRPSPSGRPSARSATTTSMPSGSARVRTTSMVCGRASASTTKAAGGVALRAAYERHRLGGGGALVEQRRVGGRQPGQVGDHGLEVEQRLEAALGDLGLVGRVGGVPGRVLEHVAPDHRRRDRRVVAQADHRLGGTVLRGERAQRPRGGLLVERVRQVERRQRCGSRRGPRPSSAPRATRARRASSMCATPASSGPMWRATNSPRRGRVAGRWRWGWRPARGLPEVASVGPPPLSARWPPECQPVRSGCLRGSGEELPLRRTPAGPWTSRGDSPARDVGEQQSNPVRRQAHAEGGQMSEAARSSGRPRRRVVGCGVSRSGGRRDGRRARRRRPGAAGSPAVRSLGSSASVPSISRQTPPMAMPKTPWPPWSRSMTSSLLVHS